MAAGLTILAASLLVRKVIRIIDYYVQTVAKKNEQGIYTKDRKVVHQKDALTLPSSHARGSRSWRELGRKEACERLRYTVQTPPNLSFLQASQSSQHHVIFATEMLAV